MSRRITFFSCCLILLFTLQAFGADRLTPPERPRIGLVLKGGGALGFAHVGVLRVLEANRVPVDYIAGTSMGSIVGAAYASGATLQEMETTLSKTDWNALFGEQISRSTIDYRFKSARGRELYGDAKFVFDNGELKLPYGFVEGQSIRPLFQRLFGNQVTPVNFDQLPVPFRAVAADLETGEAFVPSQGDLATIVRASMSVPGAFPPVEFEGHVLIDGGVVDNLPVDVALKMGADILIVVDLQSEMAKRDALNNPLSISGQMVSLLFLQNSERSLKLVRPEDVLIQPNVNGYTVTDFPKGGELADIGEKTALKSVDELKKLSLSPEEYAEYQRKRTIRPEYRTPIEFIRITRNTEYTGDRFTKKMKLKPGEEFDPVVVEKEMQKIYDTGYFRSAQYTRAVEDDETGLVISLKEKDWLSHFARIGFALEDDFDGNESFRLGASYREHGALGGNGYGEIDFEIGKSPELELEMVQYFSADSDYFINPIASITRTDIIVLQGNTEVAEYARTEGGGTFGIGRRLGTLGEALVSYTREKGRINREVGEPTLPNRDYNIGDITPGFVLDVLDKPDFPTQGYLVSANYTSAIEALGSSDGFERISGKATLPYTFDRNTLIFKTDYGTTFGLCPIERVYSLGGFLQVSGYLNNSLVASDFVNGEIIGYRRYPAINNPLFNLDFYLGSSFEATRLVNDSNSFQNDNTIFSGSVFVGADTPILPVYLGFGTSSTQENSIYLIMGRLSRSTN